MTAKNWLFKYTRPVFKQHVLVFAFIEAASFLGLGKLLPLEGLLRVLPILNRTLMLLDDCGPFALPRRKRIRPTPIGV